MKIHDFPPSPNAARVRIALAEKGLSPQAAFVTVDLTKAEHKQDAFLKLWTHAARWEPGKAKFETWLYRVTMNKCYDRLRKRQGASLDEAAEVADPAPPADCVLENAELAGQIESALAALPERQRAAILLCHQQEKGNIEAAEILGISVEALESLLARGRRALRSRLGHLRE